MKINFKKIFFLIFLLILSSVSLFASNVDELMKLGNEHYQKKDYQKAIDSYQQLVDEGYKGASLFYNLGNAYFKNDKLGYAILNYEKALKFSPGDEDIQHNLAIANSKAIDKIDTLPKFFLFQWWESLLAIFTITGWTYLSYFLFLLILIAAGIYFLVRRPGIQRMSFFGGLIILLFFILSVTILVVKLNREESIKRGIIVSSAISVKVSPDQNSNDAFVIHEGLKVQLEDKVDNWVKIKLHDGKVGWLPESDVGEI
ncbi:MAG TPA: tetratricopeptide repeat protein [Ignavibacteriaceae bacterium]|nr:tetratricopeptide repeat protein [Ignavibacteriaceae bacterium]